MNKTIFAIIAFLIVVFSGAVCASDAESFFKKAETAFKSKQMDVAESRLLEALELESENAVYRYILGQVQFMQKNFIGAKANMEIVSRLRPSPSKGEEYNKKLKAYKKR